MEWEQHFTKKIKAENSLEQNYRKILHQTEQDYLINFFEIYTLKKVNQLMNLTVAWMKNLWILQKLACNIFMEYS